VGEAGKGGHEGRCTLVPKPIVVQVQGHQPGYGGEGRGKNLHTPPMQPRLEEVEVGEAGKAR
jgi:hypothetical protein